MIIKQFSRDPCALLKPRPSSLNDSWIMRGRAQEIQPITYKHMALNGNTGALDEGTPYYYEVRINWHTGEITCFNDLQDALNHTPIMQTNYKILLVQPPPRTCDEYVQEVFAFMQRGHSMLHPECQCHLSMMCEERIKELGLTRRGSGVVCLVERKKERKTLEEIALELNVESLHGLIVYGQKKKKISLLDMLIQFAGMVATQSCSSSESQHHYLHSPLCCIPPFIQTVDDIVQAASIMKPFPYVITEEQVAMWLDFLKKDERVMLISISPTICNVFRSTTTILDAGTLGKKRGADDDIKQLWMKEEPAREEQNIMKRAEGMDALLKREGLKPMETRPAAFQHTSPKIIISRKAKRKRF
jgi:hypothetical protein